MRKSKNRVVAIGIVAILLIHAWTDWVWPHLRRDISADEAGWISSSSVLVEADSVALATEHSEWLRKWTQIVVGHGGPESLRELATEYRSLSSGSEEAATNLEAAAMSLESGDLMLEERSFSRASKYYEEVADRLAPLANKLRSDAATMEAATGLRLTGSSRVAHGVVPYSSDITLATVERWIDGDTVETSMGRARLVGIDAPEMSKGCEAAEQAKSVAEEMAPSGTTVVLANPDSVRDTDRYERVLRYVDVDGSDLEAPVGKPTIDVGLTLLKAHLAIPRYDSKDGFQWHPRESLYRATRAGSELPSSCFRTGDEVGEESPATGDELDRGRTDLMRDLVAPAIAARANLAHRVSVHQRQAAEEVRARDEGQADSSSGADARNAPDTVPQPRPTSGSTPRETAEPPAPTPAVTDPPEPSGTADVPEPTDTGTDSGTGTGSGDPYPGYTGPRCYEPGGVIWHPCP